MIARTGPADTPYVSNGAVKIARDDQGVLSGIILVVPRDRDKIMKGRRKKFLADIRHQLERQFDRTAAPQQVIDTILDRIDDARIEGIACQTMEVAMFRTGELRIWFDMRFFLGREVHAQAIPPSPEELELAEALPPQAYFFAKDITHLHYHHEPDSDQLLPLTRLQAVATAADHEANELNWRRETLWGLARVVSQYRQRNTLYDFKKVLGMLAYADAFQSTLALVWRKQSLDDLIEPHDRLSRYDFAHTRSSVEAMESLATWKRSGGLQLFAIMAGVVLSSLALWAGAVQIRPMVCPEPIGNGKSVPHCPPVHYMDTASAVVWVTQNPVLFTAIIFLIGFATFVLVFRDVTFIPFGKRLQRALSRLSKAIGTTMSRLVKVDSGLADWLGYLSALSVLGATLSGAVLLAINRNAIGETIAGWISWLLGIAP
ncbi:hypothetical protein AB5I39_08730 [Sphingomonas sp. MMS24-J45]|uniref:hypothetical protein n=1 Tax=Sphingomonas sp. MMS24-J45 TaxID=3238806 RepID=UPI00384CCCE9